MNSPRVRAWLLPWWRDNDRNHQVSENRNTGAIYLRGRRIVRTSAHSWKVPFLEQPRSESRLRFRSFALPIGCLPEQFHGARFLGRLALVLGPRSSDSRP